MHMVFLICVSTILAVNPTNTQTTDADHFGIILDGGSSGTKLKIFQWRWKTKRSQDTGMADADENRARKTFDIDMIVNEKTKPGVSELAHKLHSVGRYLQMIIGKAMEVIPRQHHRNTPIHFMATAGLRTLPSIVTEELLDSIKRHLSNSSLNPFAFNNGEVRVISGEEEGVYAWVAANYLRGFFSTAMPPSQSVGVLEMGGGSTQIAFLPDHSVYANMFPVRINGKTYHLYAHSYLFYGQNYIVSRINEYLVALGGSKPEIENPCMLKGDNTTVKSFGKSVLIHGSADVTKCLEIIDIFLKTADDNWCYPKPCAIGRTYQPPVGRTIFFAISAFIYAPEYLKSVDTFGRLNVTRLRLNAMDHCRKTLVEVVSTGLKAEYASQYCTMGLYIPALLLDAYQFNETRNTIYVRSDIDGASIDWTLGAILIKIEDFSKENSCDTSDSVRTHASSYALYIYTILICVFIATKKPV